jgi:WD40 repeat protein
LLASGDTFTIHVIDRQAGRQLHTFRGERQFIHLAFSPDGQALAATTDGYAPRLRLWDMATGEEQPVRTAGRGQGNTGLAFHPGGRFAATVNLLNPYVQVWDVTPSGQVVQSLDLLGNRNANCVAYSPEGRYVAAGLITGVILIYRAGP